MNPNEGKCWILHLGWDNAECMDRLGNKRLENSAVERGRGGVDTASLINYYSWK